MKTTGLLIGFLFVSFFALGEDHPDHVFYADLQKVEAKYRASKAELIKKADRVVVYLVDFDGNKEVPVGPFNGDWILITPNKGVTRILSSKEVDGESRIKLLTALGEQIAKPEHSGGAMCHFPIHGIRVYAGEDVLHEGTFCWLCSNFSFTYPQGSSWLDTTIELKTLFNSLVPIPQKELDRFYTKFPSAKPKGEQDGAAKPIQRQVAE